MPARGLDPLVMGAERPTGVAAQGIGRVRHEPRDAARAADAVELAVEDRRIGQGCGAKALEIREDAAVDQGADLMARFQAAALEVEDVV